MNGAIILDKPSGITSHDAVRAVRRICRERSVGHTGTLDPFATGVLILLLGKATRLSRYLVSATKSYEASMHVGFATDTYDFTGKATGPDQPIELNPDKIRFLFSEFTGSRMQRPPAYSAKKISGVPAYRMARKGKPVSLNPIEINISDLTVIEIKEKVVRFSVSCSSGTYVRVLANDLGERLGVGAHLTELRRVAVGDLRIEQAVTLEELERDVCEARSPSSLMPMESLLGDLPSYVLSEGDYSRVVNGQSVSLSSQASCEAGCIRLLSPEGALAAIAQHEHGGWYHPQVVLCATAVSSSSPDCPAVPAIT